jgi:integrase
MSVQTLLPTTVTTGNTPLAFVEPNPLFPADMPVSYDTAGQVASRYGEPAWDLRSMSTDGTTRQALHFFCPDPTHASPLDLLTREQQKALIWFHMDAGRTRSWRTLRNTNLALTFWCGVASRRGVDLFTLLSNPEWLAEGSRDLNTTYLHNTTSALQTLWRHRKELGAPVDIQLQTLRETLHIEARRRPEPQQTPLIPSRVYCTILVGLADRMKFIERELDLLLDAYEQDRAASRDAPKSFNQDQRAAYRAKALADVIERMKTLGYDSTRNRGLDNFIAGRLGEHQMALTLAVAAYTGMRVGEVSILPLEGVLKSFTHLGCTHFELHGATHKLNKGVKLRTTWITSDQGARAVRLAQRISQAVLRVHARPANTGQQALLFPALANPYKRMSDLSRDGYLKRVREVVCPVIEQADLDELDRLELARGWAREDIVVGKRWPLAFHQLRRSLAVYAHRSGMVSLPALKAQLQHITGEMTLYYSAGFSRAVNLVFDKTHFSHEWEAAKAESSYFGYVFAVLFSDEELLGQGVARMANAVERRSREDSLRLFQAGKVAFQETPLGGCVSTEECKTDPLEPLPYDCLESNCVNLVVFEKRLEHVIQYQQSAVAKLAMDESGSVEHRLEARHLAVLLKARERLTKGAA